MARNSKSKRYFPSTPSLFEREIQVDPKAIGIVMGKGCSTIKSLKEIPGITSIHCFPDGKIQILANSQQALETVICAIEQRVIFFLGKSGGYSPDLFAYCFCKSLQDPLLAVNKVCFEEFRNNNSNLSQRYTASGSPFFCLKSGEICEDWMTTPQHDVDILASEISDKTSKMFFLCNWDLSAYRRELQSCMEPLFEMESKRSIKLFISFGKALFLGACSSELRHGGFMPVARLQDLCREDFLERRFSTACSDSAVKDLKLLHLQTLRYQKVSTSKKIDIHVVDLQSLQLQFNVSVCCKGCERIAIRRERNEPKRHGFVTFCREGSAKTDFRVGVMTHTNDMEADREMVEWIDKAWRNRTPNGLLVFDPPGRFLATNVSYKDSDTYVTEDWKFRIQQVGQWNTSKKQYFNKLDCSLSSRWFKRNVNQIAKHHMNSVLENVAELVREAAKISLLIDVK